MKNSTLLSTIRTYTNTGLKDFGSVDEDDKEPDSTRTRARTMLNSNEKRECSNRSIDLCATFQLATGVSFRTRQISLAYIYPILGMISRGRIMTKTIIFAQVRRTPGHFKNEAIRL